MMMVTGMGNRVWVGGVGASERLEVCMFFFRIWLVGLV